MREDDPLRLLIQHRDALEAEAERLEEEACELSHTIYEAAQLMVRAECQHDEWKHIGSEMKMTPVVDKEMCTNCHRQRRVYKQDGRIEMTDKYGWYA